MAIAFISFGVWIHHMFATGMPVLALSFFSAVSLIIAIPSGVQFFSWIATMWGSPDPMAHPDAVLDRASCSSSSIGGLAG